MTDFEKMVIWDDDRDDDRDDDEEGSGGYFIDPDELAEKVYLDTVVFLLRDVADTTENRKTLEALLSGRVLEPAQYDDDETREFLDIEIKRLFGKTCGAETAGEYETYRNALVYCTATSSIGSLLDWDEELVYTYWDGSNWKDLWYHEEYMTQTEVLFNPDEAEVLDTWDGSNWSFLGKFNHGKLVPLVEIDGKKVEGKHLLIQYSDYQGSIPTARIIEDAEAETLLKEQEEA